MTKNAPMIERCWSLAHWSPRKALQPPCGVVNWLTNDRGLRDDQCLPRIDEIRVGNVVRKLKRVDGLAELERDTVEGITRSHDIGRTAARISRAARFSATWRSSGRYIQDLPRIKEVGIDVRIGGPKRRNADAELARNGIQPIAALNGVGGRTGTRRRSHRTWSVSSLGRRFRRGSRNHSASSSRNIDDLTGINPIWIESGIGRDDGLG